MRELVAPVTSAVTLCLIPVVLGIRHIGTRFGYGLATIVFCAAGIRVAFPAEWDAASTAALRGISALQAS